MEKRASRLRKGQSSPERLCHISNISTTLASALPTTAMEGSSGKITGRIKFLMDTSEENWPHPYSQSQSLKRNHNKSCLHLPCARTTPFIYSPHSVVFFFCYESFLLEAIWSRKSVSIMSDDCSPPELLLMLLRSQRTHKNLAFATFSFL